MPGLPPRAETMRKVAAGEPLSVDEENMLREMACRTVDLPNSITDSMGTRQALRAIPDDELYYCMLMEDHPGPYTCFSVLLGEYCPDSGRHFFDCDATEDDYEVGMEEQYTESEGGSLPEPGAGATGWFKRMPFKWSDSGYIYLVVSLDCESAGACGARDNVLSSGECPEQTTDPCLEV